MLLGICGREGAGKTTIADYLTAQGSQIPVQPYKKIDHPWAYVVSQLLNKDYKTMCVVIPNNCSVDDFKTITHLDVREFLVSVSSAIESVFPGFMKDIPKTADIPVESNISSGWNQIVLSEPLKNICTALTDFDHEILLGLTPENRDLRETLTIQFGEREITGRTLLEQMGTDVFRDQINPDFWIDLAKIKIESNPNGKFVIPDIRFENENALIKSMNGMTICVFRDPNDLHITETDRKSHPAKWKFLEFEKSNPIAIHNNGTIDDLKKEIHRRFIDPYSSPF